MSKSYRDPRGKRDLVEDQDLETEGKQKRHARFDLTRLLQDLYDSEVCRIRSTLVGG